MPRTHLLAGQFRRWTNRVRAIFITKLDEHDTALDALEATTGTQTTAITALVAEDGVDTARLDALEIRAKWIYAVLKPTIHMEADTEGVLALTPFVGTELQAAADARAEALRTALGLHMAGVGTNLVDGEHKAAETAVASTLAAIPAAIDFGTCTTLTLGLLNAIIAHGNSAGKHFKDDTTSGGTGAAITTNPPTTLAELLTDLNDIRQAMLNHMVAASIGPPIPALT